MALGQARRSAGWSPTQVARALRLHPRTIARWELGESEPRDRQWVRVLAFYAERVPSIAETLATSVGRSLPAISHPPPDPHAASRVIALAADALDVAPKRVREVLQAASLAAGDVGVTLDVVLHQLASSPPSERR